jgi:histone H3/H4
MSDTIVKSAVRDELSDRQISRDFFEALDAEVKEILDDAARRAESNNRKTVQARDL